MKIEIRPLVDNDWKVVHKLSRELGYDIDARVIKKQLKAICSQKDHHAFMALVEGIGVGYIHMVWNIRLTTEPFIEIVALIVNEPLRGQGVGKLLMQQVKAWKPNSKVRVRCNTRRTKAHQFYFDQGYKELKEQKVFELVAKKE